MKLYHGIGVVAASLKARKTRSLLASLGIVIGIASVIVMVSIGKGSQFEVLDIIRSMGENLITVTAGESRKRGGRLSLTGNVNTLTAKDAEFLLDEVESLERAAPFESRFLNVKFGNAVVQARVAGTTLDFLPIRKYKVKAGRFIDDEDLKLARRVVVLGKTTIKNIFGEDDPLGQTLRIKTIPFTVVGIFEAKGIDSQGEDQDDILAIPLTTMLRRILNQTHIDTIYFQASSRESMHAAIERIREALRGRHRLIENVEDDFAIQSQMDLEELELETEKTFTALIVGVATISLVVGGIGILAVMLISVKERTREIGVRRAVGATRADIILQFLLESLVIGGIGGIIGICLGVGITEGLAEWSPWLLILDPRSIGVSAGVCVVIGIAFGLYPAVKASRLDPMDALKVE
ncbi:MAG: ABC transporter permease [Nitrospinales bacterium]